MFRISTADYEQRRHVFAFHTWVSSVLKEMDNQEDFDHVYFERLGVNVKKFLEEAIPIAYFGLSLLRPGDDVFIKCLTGNQPFDAQIDVQGWRNYEIKVEVTVTEADDSTLRRQALSRNGYVSSGPVRRAGRSILNEHEMVNVDETVAQLIDLAYDRFKKKIEHGYDKDTAILIFVGDLFPWRVPLYWRDNIVKRTQDLLRREMPEVHGVYYCYARDFSVDAVPIPKR